MDSLLSFTRKRSQATAQPHVQQQHHPNQSYHHHHHLRSSSSTTTPFAARFRKAPLFVKALLAALSFSILVSIALSISFLLHPIARSSSSSEKEEEKKTDGGDALLNGRLEVPQRHHRTISSKALSSSREDSNEERASFVNPSSSLGDRTKQRSFDVVNGNYDYAAGDDDRDSVNEDESDSHLATVLDCYEKGRDAATGINYFFDARSAVCRPFPQQLTRATPWRSVNRKIGGSDQERGKKAEKDVAVREGEKGEGKAGDSSPSFQANDNDDDSFYHLGVGYGYEPPPDVSTVPVLEAFERQQWMADRGLLLGTQKEKKDEINDNTHQKNRGSSGDDSDGNDPRPVFSPSPSPSSPSSSASPPSAEVTVTERHAPSAFHTQWLFNDWRLWEGELGLQRCDTEDNDKNEKGDGQQDVSLSSTASSSLPSTAAMFSTYGAHREENLNRLYQIDNFCIDQDDGTLIGFYDQNDKKIVSSGKDGGKDGGDDDCESLRDDDDNAGDGKCSTDSGGSNPLQSLISNVWSVFGRENENAFYKNENKYQRCLVNKNKKKKHNKKKVLAVEGASNVRLPIEIPQGITEHEEIAAYEPNGRMFHPANQLPIRLVVDENDKTMMKSSGGGVVVVGGGGDNDNFKTFKKVITSSLNAHYAGVGTDPEAYPEVFFVDSPALLHPLQSGEEDNPMHTFLRIGTSQAIKAVMNLGNVIMTYESVAPSPQSVFLPLPARTKLFTPLLASLGLPNSSLLAAASSSSLSASQYHTIAPTMMIDDETAILLALPDYLRTLAEEERLGEEEGEKKEDKRGDESLIATTIKKRDRNRLLLEPLKLSDIAGVLSLSLREETTSNAAFAASTPSYNNDNLSSSQFLAAAAYHHLCAGVGGASIPYELFAGHNVKPRDPRQKASTLPMVDSLTAALLELNDEKGTLQQFRIVYGMLLSSGKDDDNAFDTRNNRSSNTQHMQKEKKRKTVCEAFRCQGSSSSSSRSISCADRDAYRKCATPYIALPISHYAPERACLGQMLTAYSEKQRELLENEEESKKKRKSYSNALLDRRVGDLKAYIATRVHWGRHVNTDTANYSKSVWNGAVRMLFREVKRIRRDILLEVDTLRRESTRENDKSKKRDEKHDDENQSDRARVIAKRRDLTDLFETIEETVSSFSTTFITAGRKKNHPPHRHRQQPPRELLETVLEGPLSVAYATSFSSSSTTSTASLHANLQSKRGSGKKEKIKFTSPSPFAYILVWRARLLRRVAASIIEKSSSSPPSQSSPLWFDDDLSSASNYPSPALFKRRRRDSQKNEKEGKEKDETKEVKEDALHVYCKELFAVLLERLQSREVFLERPQLFFLPLTSSALPSSSSEEMVTRQQKQLRRPQLICYRKAYSTHIRYKDEGYGTIQRASLLCYSPANCRLKESLGFIYGAMWQRYGMCSRRHDDDDVDNENITDDNKRSDLAITAAAAAAGLAKEKKTNGEVEGKAGHDNNKKSNGAKVNHNHKPPLLPFRDTQRDAHPIFALPRHESAALADAFTASAAAVERIVGETARALLAIATEEEEGVDDHQKGKHRFGRGRCGSSRIEEKFTVVQQPPWETDFFDGYPVGVKPQIMRTIPPSSRAHQHTADHAEGNNDDNNHHSPRLLTIEERVAEILLDSTAQIEEAQRAYDDVFMSYFRRRRFGTKQMRSSSNNNNDENGEGRNGNVKSGSDSLLQGDSLLHPVSSSSSSSSSSSLLPRQSRSAGRPIRLYQTHRSSGRAFALFRQHLSRLSVSGENADAGGITLSSSSSSSSFSIFDFIDVEVLESSKQYPEAYTLRNDSQRPYVIDGEVEKEEEDHWPEPAVAIRSLSSSSSSVSSLPPLRHSRTLNTPRARQVHAALRADLIVGTHGAELHSLVFLKPSALVNEILIPAYDTAVHFNGGYFGNLAFGKQIAYLRSYAHRTHNWPDRKGEKGVSTIGKLGYENSGQNFLTLPEMRQLYSVDVCAWLSTNIVRLAKEEAQGNDNHANVKENEAKRNVRSYSYLLPWWCRGGSSAVMRSLLLQLKERELLEKKGASAFLNNNFKDNLKGHCLSPPPPAERGEKRKKKKNDKEEEGQQQQNNDNKANAKRTQRASLSVRALMHPSYYTVRMISTPYGFVEPYCPPLYSEVEWGSLGSFSGGQHDDQHEDEGENSHPATTSSSSHAFKLRVRDIDYNTLIAIQNDCVRGVTLGSQGSVILNGGKQRVVGESERANEAQRLRVEGLQTLLESVFMKASSLDCQLVARLIISGVPRGLRHRTSSEKNNINQHQHEEQQHQPLPATIRRSLVQESAVDLDGFEDVFLHDSDTLLTSPFHHSTASGFGSGSSSIVLAPLYHRQRRNASYSSQRQQQQVVNDHKGGGRRHRTEQDEGDDRNERVWCRDGKPMAFNPYFFFDWGGDKLAAEREHARSCLHAILLFLTNPSSSLFDGDHHHHHSRFDRIRNIEINSRDGEQQQRRNMSEVSSSDFFIYSLHPAMATALSRQRTPFVLLRKNLEVFAIRSETTRFRIVEWLVEEFMRLFSKSTTMRIANSPFVTDAFGYGHDCGRWL